MGSGGFDSRFNIIRSDFTAVVGQLLGGNDGNASSHEVYHYYLFASLPPAANLMGKYHLRL